MNKSLGISMKRLAALAQVSHSTVSLVLSGKWRANRISERVADRVCALAKTHGCRPNRLVQALRSGRTHTVAFVLPVVAGHYFPRIVDGVEEEAKRHGYHLLISMVHGMEEEGGEIEVLLERRMDGLIVVPRFGASNRANYRRLVAQGVPLVCVDEYFPDVPCPAVMGEDERGAYLAAEHLVRLGHRRLAFVGERNSPSTHWVDRYRGFQRALAACGLPRGAGRLIGFTPEEIARALASRLRPTAVLALNDRYALQTIGLAEAAGLSVPRDLAVVGFSDYLENVTHLRVPLTSVRVDACEMGRRAMRRLLGESERPSRRHSVERLPAELIVRASCGAAVGARENAAAEGQ